MPALVASVVAAPTAAAAEPESARIILVGDSTMATRTGYGDALCSLFQTNVKCINLARGGRSSMSFRAEGLWDNVMTLLRNPESAGKTYVLIQFGHNDQPGKLGRSTDLATEFPVNIARYVDEVMSVGGVPVLVTPLTRRTFKGGELLNDLVPWADAMRRVAKGKSAPLLELNAKSAAAVSLMGSSEANTLAEEPPPPLPAAATVILDSAMAEPNVAAKSRFDYTHLGAKGAALFSRMMVRELVETVPALITQVRSDALR